MAISVVYITFTGGFDGYRTHGILVYGFQRRHLLTTRRADPRTKEGLVSINNPRRNRIHTVSSKSVIHYFIFDIRRIKLPVMCAGPCAGLHETTTAIFYGVTQLCGSPARRPHGQRTVFKLTLKRAIGTNVDGNCPPTVYWALRRARRRSTVPTFYADGNFIRDHYFCWFSPCGTLLRPNLQAHPPPQEARKTLDEDHTPTSSTRHAVDFPKASCCVNASGAFFDDVGREARATARTYRGTVNCCGTVFFN